MPDTHNPPVPVILGSAMNAYGLIRSLGEAGIHSIIADRTLGPAMFSKYLLARWRLATGKPSAGAIRDLCQYASRRKPRPLLIPTDEAWVTAMVKNRRLLERYFILPLGCSDIVSLVMTKTRMHQWCLRNQVLVPHTVTFAPGQDWLAFLGSAEPFLPVIVKPETKGVGDISFGFPYKEFQTMESLLSWGRSQGDHGPGCGVLFQVVIQGPTDNLLSYQGYRSKGGTVYMAGYTKLRQNPPVHGCASAAYLRADEESARATEDLLLKLNYVGFFDVEFKRDARTRSLFFIELNPRPGMLNYGATVLGVNIPCCALADAAGVDLQPGKVVIAGRGLWIELLPDLLSHVLYYRRIGHGTSLGEWCRTVQSWPIVEAFGNLEDPLVYCAHLVLYARECFRHLPGLLRRVPGRSPPDITERVARRGQRPGQLSGGRHRSRQ